MKHSCWKYVVYVDYTKAFDSADRSILLEKLSKLIGREHAITLTVQNFLHKNYVCIEDGTTLSSPVLQTNGVLQGDPLSPLLFNILTADVVSSVKKPGRNVELFLYADDMAIASNSREQLQEAINDLSHWANVNKLSIHPKKTNLMVFKAGGRKATADRILLNGSPIPTVASYTYLGVEFQCSGKSFAMHTKAKAIAAIRAMSDIPALTKLSFTTAMKLFRAKIVPVITYALQVIWPHLTKTDFAVLESVKATFLKRVMSLSKFTKSRLVYEMAGEQFLIEELVTWQPYSSAATEHIRIRKEKRSEIWPEFYGTEALIFRERWQQPNYDMRHVITRYAVHGFHWKICVKVHYHDPDLTCVCKLCGGRAVIYHLERCPGRRAPLRHFAEE